MKKLMSFKEMKKSEEKTKCAHCDQMKPSDEIAMTGKFQDTPVCYDCDHKANQEPVLPRDVGAFEHGVNRIRKSEGLISIKEIVGRAMEKLAKGEPSSTVKADVDKQVAAHMAANPGMKLHEAAQKHLASKEGWYKQTPEGEYATKLSVPKV
jgi:hypothetical protein